MKSFAADAAHALMTLLVALYIAMLAALMRTSAMPVPVFFLIAAGAFLLGMALSRRLGKMGFVLSTERAPADSRVFWGAAGFCLLVQIVYLVGFYPGGFSSDTGYQWRQITGIAELSDWHPALHTLFLALLARFSLNPALACFVQAVCYALSVGYMTSTLWRWRVPRVLCILSALYLSASPGISNLMAFPWKDCAFAICTLILAAQMFSLHASQGSWLMRKRNVLALGVTLCLSAILRHNGIALTLAAMVWLFVSFPRQFRRMLCVLLCAAALFASIKGPLYAAAGVTKEKTRIDELIGLPMTILAHIYVEAPESLDEDIITFLEDVAPREVFTEHRRTGDWNETKWFVGYIYTNKPYTVVDVFSFALRAMLAEPDLGLEALGLLWQMPMWPVSDAYWRISPHVDPSAAQFGIEQRQFALFSRPLNWLSRISSHPALAWAFWLPGFYLLAMMIFCVLFARQRPLSALLMPAMLIAYHLATCIVLSSSTDYRFFLSLMLCAPAALLALLAHPASASRKELP